MCVCLRYFFFLINANYNGKNNIFSAYLSEVGWPMGKKGVNDGRGEWEER